MPTAADPLGANRVLSSPAGAVSTSRRASARRGRVGIAARAEGQALHLAADRLDHPRVAVAELMDAVAVEIENALAVDVGEPGALGADDFGQARRRQRLAQKIALVLVERRARPLAQATRAIRRAPG